MCAGVSKVPGRKELKEAVEAALRHDSQVVVEPCTVLNCTVLYCTGGGGALRGGGGGGHLHRARHHA